MSLGKQSKDAVFLFLTTCSNKKDKNYCIPNYSMLKIVCASIHAIWTNFAHSSTEEVDCDKSLMPFSDVEK